MCKEPHPDWSFTAFANRPRTRHSAEVSWVHAVPMRAASTVLGPLGLFGTGVGELNDADRLVAQTLAHIACVAILHGTPAVSGRWCGGPSA
jgi:hypothetical protein